MDLRNGFRIQSSNWITSLLAPLTIWSVPMFQRISFWTHMSGRDKDYDSFRADHDALAPWILGPMAAMGSYKYTPILHFRGCTQEEFKDDIVNKTLVMIGNHVGYSDFAVLLQLARFYDVESKITTYFMEEINRWPVIGPSFWGQIPLMRDGTGKDDQVLHERLTMFANSSCETLIAVFPEGGLRRNPKLYERSKQKEQELGIKFQYMNYPKVKGFTKLIEIVGKKADSVYEFTLLYPAHRKNVGNDVHVIVTKVCEVKDIPVEPSAEFVAHHKVQIDDTNRLHYAHEEFMLGRFKSMDESLIQFYSDVPDDQKPTVENLHLRREHDND